MSINFENSSSFRCVSCRALGDAFSQKIEGAERVDLKRSLKTSVYGAAFIGKDHLHNDQHAHLPNQPTFPARLCHLCR